MNAKTNDTQEVKDSLQKAIEQTKVTADYLKRKIEEKRAEVNQHVSKKNAETVKDLQQIQNDVVQLIEENELLKKQKLPSKTRAMQEERVDAGRSTLQAAESRNTQLSKRLAKAEAELQALRMSQLRMENVAATKTATQNASLIEKLYSAQKDRDKAVEEERLSTTKKLSQVEKQLQKERAKQNSKADSEMDHNAEKLLPVLLDELAEASGAEQIKQKGQTLLDHIYEWQRLQNKRPAMNQSTVQTEQLMREIERLKKQTGVGATEHQLKSLQDQLKDAIHEKDKVIYQLQKLESDHEELKIIYSLQRHLTQEGEIKQQYEKKIDQYKEQLEKAEEEIIRISEQLNHSIKERNAVIQSRNQLAQDLTTEQERSEKLDRIVIVLRRKVQASSADSTPVHL